MALLAAGIPPSLLIDLLDPPDSRAIYVDEAISDDVRRDTDALTHLRRSTDARDFFDAAGAC